MNKVLDTMIIEERREAGGYDFFKERKNTLLQYEPKTLMLYCFNNPKMYYHSMNYILLGVPEIWKDFNLEDWLYIIRNIKRPKKYRVLLDDTAEFEDIKFLYKWIEIDSILLYKNDSEIDSKTKKILNKTLKSYGYDFFKRDNYMEYFDDNIYGDRKYFTKMKERLLKQGAKEAQFKDDMTEIELLWDYIMTDDK